MTLECFKILYKLSPPCLNDLVVLKNSNRSNAIKEFSIAFYVK